jgi:DNA-binding XRE family transcriptional regulator
MNMNSAKKARLEAAGWKVGSAEDFLGLSAAEAAYVGMKLGLAHRLRERRQRRKLSQTQLAKVLGSSQSRVAKMEAADPTVSADLLIRSLLTLGSTRRELATVIGRLKVKTAV